MSAFQKLPTGSILRYGKEIVELSASDFSQLITGKQKCFICAESAKQNKEHVIPNWIVRRCGLENYNIVLPKNKVHRFTTYTVPMCIRCNSLLGRDLEGPVSEAFESGYSAVKKMAENLDARLYAWINFLYLKTHYKDLFISFSKDRRKGHSSLGDGLEWNNFRSAHAIVRAYVFGSYVSYSAVGSMKVLSVTEDERLPKFSYRDEYENRSIYIRVNQVVLIGCIDDLGSCKYFLDQFQLNLVSEISVLQSLSVLNEYEVASRRLFGKWALAHEYDPSDGSIRLEGDIFEPIGVRPTDENFRREGLRYQVLPYLEQNSIDHETVGTILAEIESGSQTLLPMSAMQTLDSSFLNSEWQFLRQPPQRIS